MPSTRMGQSTPHPNEFELVNASGKPASILYLGAAPGLIYVVFQVNVQLLPDALGLLTLRTYSPPAFGSAAILSGST